MENIQKTNSSSGASIGQKIARASVLLMIASIAGHALSLLKEIIVANQFGITKVMDAYYAAMTIPNLVNNILLSTFASVFIPVFIKYKVQDRKEANIFASVIIKKILVLSIFIAGLIFFFSNLIVKIGFGGFTPETTALATHLLRLTSITIILTSLTGLFTGILHSEEHFAVPAFSQMFITLFTILFLLTLTEKYGIYVLVYGLIAGLFLQLIFVLFTAFRKGFSFHLDSVFQGSLFNEIYKPSLIFLVAIMLVQANTAIDMLMASWLDSGSLSALGYASKLANVPILIFAISIANAVLPFFSKLSAENNMDALSHTFSKTLRICFFIFIPLTIFSIIFAHPLISIMFQRGAFTGRATDLTASVFSFYSLQFLFYSVTLLIVKLLLSMGKVKHYLALQAMCCFLNVVLNFLLIKFIRPPVAGLALATSLVFLMSSLMGIKLLKNLKVYIDLKYILFGLLKSAISALLLFLSTYSAYKYFMTSGTYLSLWGNLTYIIFSTLIGIFVFLISSVLLKSEELKSIYFLFNKSSDRDIL